MTSAEARIAVPAAAEAACRVAAADQPARPVDALLAPLQARPVRARQPDRLRTRSSCSASSASRSSRTRSGTGRTSRSRSRTARRSEPVGPWTHVRDATSTSEALATHKTTLFVLGADGRLGRDEFIRLLKGGQTSLEVGLGVDLPRAAHRRAARSARRPDRRLDGRRRLAHDGVLHGLPDLAPARGARLLGAQQARSGDASSRVRAGRPVADRC